MSPMGPMPDATAAGEARDHLVLQAADGGLGGPMEARGEVKNKGQHTEVKGESADLTHFTDLPRESPWERATTSSGESGPWESATTSSGESAFATGGSRIWRSTP
jgi:hypothetical protein